MRGYNYKTEMGAVIIIIVIMVESEASTHEFYDGMAHDYT